MTVSAFSSGTQTCTVGTEHALADVNVAGTYVFEVDLNAAVDGDVFLLQLYKIILTAGTGHLVASQRYYGSQASDPIKTSIPLSNELTDTDSLKFTITQQFGTSRNVPYKALKHA